MERLKRLIEQWQNEEGKNQNTRYKVINQIHLCEYLIMKAKYEIKYFEVQDHVPDRNRREQDFHREDFYRFPILRFLYINNHPDLNIRQAIKGIAEMLKDQLVLLDFERGEAGMPRWNRNIRFASDYLRKCGLIETINYNPKQNVRKWALTIKGTLFYVYANQDYEVVKIENHQNKWVCNFDALYKDFFPFTVRTKERLRASLIKRIREPLLAEKIISLYENIRDDDEQGFTKLKGLIRKCHNLTKDEKRYVLSYESPDCNKKSNLVLLFKDEP